MKMPRVLIIDRYDGSDPEDTSTDPTLARCREDLEEKFGYNWTPRWKAGDPEVRDYARQRFEYHLFMPDAVKTHNMAVPAAQQYAQACADAERAMAEAEVLYADLSKNTTINWLAAHHRYMLAVVRVRELLTARVDAALALAEGRFGKYMIGLARFYYEQQVPADERIEVPDVDAARLALTKFVEETRARIDILRATISAGYPEGFAPAPEHVIPAQPGPVDDDWAADQSASVAVAASERGW